MLRKFSLYKGRANRHKRLFAMWTYYMQRVPSESKAQSYEEWLEGYASRLEGRLRAEYNLKKKEA